MTEAFFDSIIPGKFICCLAREKRLFGELNCSFLHGYTAYQQKLLSCTAPCDSVPPPPESSAHALRTGDSWLASLSTHFPTHFTRRAHEYPVTLTSFSVHGIYPVSSESSPQSSPESRVHAGFALTRLGTRLHVVGHETTCMCTRTQIFMARLEQVLGIELGK